MQNINPYNEEKFKSRFENSNLCRTIEKDFNELLWSKHSQLADNRPPDAFDRDSITIRQLVGETYNKFSMVPFYYLEPLLEKSPELIYDLGCGWNIFKKYIPNVIGIGAESQHSEFFYADHWDFIDEEYIKNHQNYFKSVFSICALHFQPIDEFPKVFSNFLSMIKPKGRGFLALNSARMIERTNNIARLGNLDSYIRNNLSNECEFIIIDIDIGRNNQQDALDGDIRLVFEKE